MSTFSGLNTAATGLAAARRGMDVVGQNIANQNTEGYTRQRIVTSPAVAPATVSRFAMPVVPGQGVSVTGVARLGDAVLDARVRDTLGAAGYWSTRAVAATAAEAALAEPTKDGLAARLTGFWAGWQDLTGGPTSGSAGAVVLESAKELVAHIAAGYQAVSTQWADARGSVDRAVGQVNAAAEQIAALNRDIRDTLAAGGSANELMDRRSVLADTVARATGATATVESDGTLTVRVDGNALVSGTDARRLTATGPTSLEAGQPVGVAWEDAPGIRISLTGGELGGLAATLAPEGDGGVLARLAATYNAVATALADSVNTQHRAGVTAAGVAGGDLFAVAATGPAALGLSVALTSPADLALAAPGMGAYDTTNADAISQLGKAAGSPDRLWSQQVIALGVATAGDVQRARQADATAVTAVAAQQSVAAVDGDEETISLLTYQSAYQAAARVITAVDEALDVLINRMGVVGR